MERLCRRRGGICHQTLYAAELQQLRTSTRMSLYERLIGIKNRQNRRISHQVLEILECFTLIGSELERFVFLLEIVKGTGDL